MNRISYYKDNGLSSEGYRDINIIVACIMDSHLDNSSKRELINFMRDLETHLEGEDDSD